MLTLQLYKRKKKNVFFLFFGRKTYIRPDIIVAYNCGLYRETGFQGTLLSSPADLNKL